MTTTILVGAPASGAFGYSPAFGPLTPKPSGLQSKDAAVLTDEARGATADGGAENFNDSAALKSALKGMTAGAQGAPAASTSGNYRDGAGGPSNAGPGTYPWLPGTPRTPNDDFVVGPTNWSAVLKADLDALAKARRHGNDVKKLEGALRNDYKQAKALGTKIDAALEKAILQALQGDVKLARK